MLEGSLQFDLDLVERIDRLFLGRMRRAHLDLFGTLVTEPRLWLYIPHLTVSAVAMFIYGDSELFQVYKAK